MKGFLQRILQEIMKKILLGKSDTWSTIHLSHRPSNPAYYIVNWRISGHVLKKFIMAQFHLFCWPMYCTANTYVARNFVTKLTSYNILVIRTAIYGSRLYRPVYYSFTWISTYLDGVYDILKDRFCILSFVIVLVIVLVIMHISNVYLLVLSKGPFNVYVDKIWSFFDQQPTST